MNAGAGRRPLGTLAADALLLTAAVIWGSTFIAQNLATAHMGPVLFIGVRYAFEALNGVIFTEMEVPTRGGNAQ